MDVYAHVNKKNNKKYIGITSSIEQRWSNDGINYKNSVFYNDGIATFGWENFEHIVLIKDVDTVLAGQIESRLIKILKTHISESGYNESRGVAIVYSKGTDDIAENLVKKVIGFIEKQEVKLQDFCKEPYLYARGQYSLRYINEKWGTSITAEMDCQRKYVWEEERQQGMWDSLLRGYNIPEIHTLRTGARFQIIDGKQRLTTIMKIIRNEIPLLMTKAMPVVKEYMKKKGISKLYFKDLDQDAQDKILNVHLSFAEYSNINDEELGTLFKKLNSGRDLNVFQKNLVNNLNIRLRFTSKFFEDPVLSKIFTEAQKANSDDELSLLRLAVLIEKGPCNGQPKDLHKHYGAFSLEVLDNLVSVVSNLINRISPYIEIFSDIRAMNSYFPIILYFLYLHPEIEQKTIGNFITKFSNEAPGARGQNFDTKIIQERLFYIEKIFQTVV